jgi:hypothetical protein
MLKIVGCRARAAPFGKSNTTCRYYARPSVRTVARPQIFPGDLDQPQKRLPFAGFFQGNSSNRIFLGEQVIRATAGADISSLHR